MLTGKSVLKSAIRQAFGLAGLEVIRKQAAADPIRERTADPKCESFDNYLERATEAGMDVNDWLESVLKWGPALSILEIVVFPHLKPNDTVCEIGAGTGRHARHILPKLNEGRVIVCDHSPWVRDFLKSYFAGQDRLTVAECTDHRVSIPDASVDIVFSNGVFIELKLGSVFAFAKEFARIVKPNGRVIFDYNDPSTLEGWQFLKREWLPHTFTYHCTPTIARVMEHFGFAVEGSHQSDISTYATFRNQASGSISQ
jgi:ubiquinone/menaquinone biosynthesis C-methylase UbiE